MTWFHKMNINKQIFCSVLQHRIFCYIIYQTQELYSHIIFNNSHWNNVNQDMYIQCTKYVATFNYCNVQGWDLFFNITKIHLCTKLLGNVYLWLNTSKWTTWVRSAKFTFCFFIYYAHSFSSRSVAIWCNFLKLDITFSRYDMILSLMTSLQISERLISRRQL